MHNEATPPPVPFVTWGDLSQQARTLARLRHGKDLYAIPPMNKETQELWDMFDTLPAPPAPELIPAPITRPRLPDDIAEAEATGWINSWEAGFLLSVRKLRHLTAKQSAIKRRLDYRITTRRAKALAASDNIKPAPGATGDTGGG